MGGLLASNSKDNHDCNLCEFDVRNFEKLRKNMLY